MAYFIAACVLDFQRALALVILTSLAIFIATYELVKKYKGKSISQCFKPAVQLFKANLRWLKWWVCSLLSVALPQGWWYWNSLTTKYAFYCGFRVFILAVVVLLAVWLGLDTSKRPEQLISFAGVCMFVLLIFLLSAHRTAVSLSPSQPPTCKTSPVANNCCEKHLSVISSLISFLFHWDFGYRLTLCPNDLRH